MARGAATIAPVSSAAALREYDFVRLRHDVHAGDATYVAGARGVIVHSHDDGVGYEVEFEVPEFRVLTLTSQDLLPDHG